MVHNMHPQDHSTILYIAAAIKSQAITMQWSTHHDNAPQITLPSSTQHPVDIPVKQTIGSSKQYIICTQLEPSTRVYAGAYAEAPIKLPSLMQLQNNGHSMTI